MQCSSCGKSLPSAATLTQRSVSCTACGTANDLTAEVTYVGAESPESGVDRKSTPSLPRDLTGRDLDNGRYRILSKIGEGGMGTVYRGVHTRLGMPVAIKVLAGRLTHDDHFVQRFQREAKVLATLRHANVVSVHDTNAEDDLHYIVMDYVAGDDGHPLTLHDRIESGDLSSDDAVRYVMDCCSALEAAHGRDVVHRDIKPGNILIASDGSALVADFGVASMRSADEDSELTTAGQAVGTVEYMAPEHRRDAASADARSDVFSLGTVLYKALTGELPIGTYRPPSECADGVDSRVDAIVAKARERDPLRRYQTARAFRDALEALRTPPTKPAAPAAARTRAAKASVSAPPAATKRAAATRKTRSVTRWVVAGAVVALLLVAGGLVVLWLPTSAALSQADAALTAARDRSPDAASQLDDAIGALDAVATPFPGLGGRIDQRRSELTRASEELEAAGVADAAREQVAAAGSLPALIRALSSAANVVSEPELADAWRARLAELDVPVDSLAGVALGAVDVGHLSWPRGASESAREIVDAVESMSPSDLGDALRREIVDAIDERADAGRAAVLVRAREEGLPTADLVGLSDAILATYGSKSPPIGVDAELAATFLLLAGRAREAGDWTRSLELAGRAKDRGSQPSTVTELSAETLEAWRSSVDLNAPAAARAALTQILAQTGTLREQATDPVPFDELRISATTALCRLLLEDDKLADAENLFASLPRSAASDARVSSTGALLSSARTARQRFDWSDAFDAAIQQARDARSAATESETASHSTWTPVLELVADARVLAAIPASLQADEQALQAHAAMSETVREEWADSVMAWIEAAEAAAFDATTNRDSEAEQSLDRLLTRLQAAESPLSEDDSVVLERRARCLLADVLMDHVGALDGRVAKAGSVLERYPAGDDPASGALELVLRLVKYPLATRGFVESIHPVGSHVVDLQAALPAAESRAIRDALSKRFERRSARSSALGHYRAGLLNANVAIALDMRNPGATYLKGLCCFEQRAESSHPAIDDGARNFFENFLSLSEKNAEEFADQRRDAERMLATLPPPPPLPPREE